MIKAWGSLGTRLGILVLKKMVLHRSQAVRFRIRVRLGSGDDMSTSECLGMSVLSRPMVELYRSGNDLPNQKFSPDPNFRDSPFNFISQPGV